MPPVASGHRRIAVQSSSLVLADARPHTPRGGAGNVRAELRVHGKIPSTKPAYRNAFKHGRCLILTEGFYEWKRVGALRHAGGRIIAAVSP